MALRGRWEATCNAHLERAGLAERIDLRSHAERGTGQDLTHYACGCIEIKTKRLMAEQFFEYDSAKALEGLEAVEIFIIGACL